MKRPVFPGAHTHSSRPRPRRLATVIALALGVFAWATSASALAPYRVPTPRVTTLPNGLTIAVFRDSRLPLVHAQLTVPAGSAAETPSQLGAAYVTTQLMGRMTSSRDADELQAELDRIGGTLTTQLGRDFAWVSASFLSRELSPGLELLSDASLQAVFPESEVERLRTIASAVLRQPSNVPQQADDGLWTALFRDTPYGRPLFGTAPGFDRLTMEQVRTFHAANWVPDHAFLVIAGDVQPDSAIAAATQWFGGWTRSGSSPTPAHRGPAKRGVRIIDRSDIPSSEVVVGVVGPPAGDPDEIPLALAAPLLGRPIPGVRAVRTGHSALHDAGVLWVGASAPVDSVDVVARRLEDRLLSLADRSRPAIPLDTLKRDVRIAFPLRFETLEDLVSQWSANAALGLPPEGLSQFADRVDQVTSDKLTDAVSRWVQKGRVMTVVVGPADRLRPKLEPIGPVEVVSSEPEPNAEPPVAPVTPADRTKGRELVRQMVVAHGGTQALQKLKDSTMEADATINMQDRSVSGHIRQIRKEPDRMVAITQFEDLGIRQLLVGQQAWSMPLDSAALAHQADTSEVATLRLAFRSDVPHILVDASDKNAQLAARGRERVDGVDMEKVEVWLPSGARRMLFIDAATHLLAAMEQGESEGGNRVKVRRRYRDIRGVSGGLKLPYEEERWLSGQRAMDLKVTRLAFNTNVPDATFTPPEQPLPRLSR